MSKRPENLKEKSYIAGMVLSGVGDALGYRNGYWEFCLDGSRIHSELQQLGGINRLKVQPHQWRVSDDTVMHLATAEALIKNKECRDKLHLYQDIAIHYINCMNDMEGREAGITCQRMCYSLRPDKVPEGLQIPFNPRGGGCGAAMRSMCIGLRYPHPCDLDDLIAVSIEAGRLTHHHPTGYLGAMASALFTSYAVQNKPLTEWGVGLLSALENAKKYISNIGSIQPLHSDTNTIDQNINEWDYFESKWKFYLGLRNIEDCQSAPRYAPDENQVRKRDQFYRMISFDDIGGASGHDAPMIAYDALLACNGNWSELCNRAMFHGGDSDSTGVIAGCLYGVLYGLKNVSRCNYEHLEYGERLTCTGKEIFLLAIADEEMHNEDKIEADKHDVKCDANQRNDSEAVHNNEGYFRDKKPNTDEIEGGLTITEEPRNENISPQGKQLEVKAVEGSELENVSGDKCVQVQIEPDNLTKESKDITNPAKEYTSDSLINGDRSAQESTGITNPEQEYISGSLINEDKNEKESTGITKPEQKYTSGSLINEDTNEQESKDMTNPEKEYTSGSHKNEERREQESKDTANPEKEYTSDSFVNEERRKNKSKDITNPEKEYTSGSLINEERREQEAKDITNQEKGYASGSLINDERSKPAAIAESDNTVSTDMEKQCD